MELTLIVWALGTLLPLVGLASLVVGIIIIIALVVFGFSAFFMATAPSEEDSEECNRVIVITKPCVIYGTLLWLFLAMIPNKETAYQMVAAYGVQTIAENEKVQELASDGLDVLQALMKKAKTELEKDNASN